MSTKSQTAVSVDAGDDKSPEIRAQGIGASEAGAACGVSAYMSPFELYQLKRGEAEPIEANEDMEFGTIVEPAIVRLYESREGVSLTYPLPRATHPELPWMFATGDAEESTDVGVEIKSMNPFRAKQITEYGLAECAPEYLCQAQHQMSIMGWSVVKLVALVERRLKTWTIDRDPELIEIIIEREAELWRRIKAGDPPPVDLSSAYALGDVKLRFSGKSSGRFVRLSADAAAAWERSRRLKAEEKACKERAEREVAAVLLEIGDNDGGILPGEAKAIKRVAISGGMVSYERKPHYQTREVNWKGGDVVEEIDSDVIPDVDKILDPDAVGLRVDNRLRSSGFLCHHVSESGSRYYIHGTRELRIRVADHEPNEKTMEWMDRHAVWSVRLDQGASDVRRQLSEVLAHLEGGDDGFSE